MLGTAIKDTYFSSFYGLNSFNDTFFLSILSTRFVWLSVAVTGKFLYTNKSIEKWDFIVPELFALTVNL